MKRSTDPPIGSAAARLVSGLQGRRELVVMLHLHRGDDGSDRRLGVVVAAGGGARAARFDHRSLPLPPVGSGAGDLSQIDALELVVAENLVYELAREAADGIDSVALLPAPALCTVPWRLLLHRSAAGRGWSLPMVGIYTSLGAWERRRPASLPSSTTPLGVVVEDSYALPAYEWLPLANAEAQMLLRLPRPDPGAPGARLLAHADLTLLPADVTDLVAIGHGRRPGRHLPPTGLLTMDARGRPSELGAACIGASGRVERIFMSACLLGDTRDHLGEPLGMITSLFDTGSSVRTAIGAVERIDDLTAVLISLAFQFEWGRRRGRQGADWGQTFVEVQTALLERRWPVGFADWLSKHLADALLDAWALPDRRLHDFYWSVFRNPPNSPLGWVATAAGLASRALLRDDWLQAPDAVRSAWGPHLRAMAATLGQRVPDWVAAAVPSYVVIGA